MLTRREIFSYGALVCPKERLLSKYVVSESGCWEYTGGKDQYGYGRFAVGPRRLGAHKVSYVIHKGDVPEGMVVMHRCDNPGCINPSHLRVGTVKDNVHDCMSKGRFFHPSIRGCNGLRGKRKQASRWKGGFSPHRRRIIVGRNDNEMIVFTDVYALKAAGYHDGSVSACVNGKSQTYRGFQWSYQDREQLKPTG